MRELPPVALLFLQLEKRYNAEKHEKNTMLIYGQCADGFEKVRAAFTQCFATLGEVEAAPASILTVVQWSISGIAWPIQMPDASDNRILWCTSIR